MSDHTASASTEKPSLLSNILAIIGLIILVIIIIWGLVHLAELSSGWFTSLFNTKSTPTIKINAPEGAVSGAPETISWSYSTTAAGSYAFLYQCQPGVQFATINATNNTATGIPCGSAVQITPTNNSIQMLPILSPSATSSASVPFTIMFTPTAGTAVQGSATMTIRPGSPQSTTQSSTTNTQTSVPAKTTTTKATKPAASGYYAAPRAPADLSVHIVSQYVDQNGNGTVTFNVQNVGGTTSGTYYFSAQMPTANGTPYTSSLQAPLAPGSYISDTLHFSPAVSGTFEVSVGARDYNQSNNYASAWINAPQNYNYNAYNNYNPYNVQYQPQPYTY
jgi:hypothetical protein